MFGTDVDVSVSILGPGEPDLAVVGGIHGDEPCGIRAIRHVLDSQPDLERAVKLIVANPPASVTQRRYLDADMNRIFPGDPDSEDRERRLAARLRDVVEDCHVLSIHSTHSSSVPLAFVSGDHPEAQRLASRLPVRYVVNQKPAIEGAFTACGSVVSVEAGRQTTEEATENAAKLVRAFLRETDALPGDPETTDSRYYSLTDAVEKPSDDERYDLLVENFHHVDPGTTYARSDDDELVAEESFYPILMSETGYDERFGYKGQKVGESLSEAREAWGAAAD
jgi:succinylglutamate desuccinylase